MKLLHESEGHVLSVSLCSRLVEAPVAQHRAAHQHKCLLLQVELKSGELYRGELTDAEDNWNIQLKNVTATAKVCCLCTLAVCSALQQVEQAANVELHGWQLCCGRKSYRECLCSQLRSASCLPPVEPWKRLPCLQDGRISHLEHIFVRGSRVR